eukprot:TRINITY_DN8379_c0_g1_i1.p1 TRINITY_DN8379_c0_g1~~TRINITY_DN8379_c0_g1_i1.p1  ORF type:complete len:917 (-),score=336.14 TRINITY_DN8379_c0_g1_i1:123-2873(-)
MPPPELLPLDGTKIKLVVEKVGVKGDVIPSGVRDPELLLRAILKKMNGEVETAKTKMVSAQTFTKKLEAAKASCEKEAQEAVDAMEKWRYDSEMWMKKAQDYEERIAFLGSRWETLTGSVNQFVVKDPIVALRKAEGDCNQAKAKAFDLGVKAVKTRRDMKNLEDALKTAEDVNERWIQELIQMRRRDEETEKNYSNFELQIEQLKDEIARLNKVIDTKNRDLREERTILEKTQSRFQESSDRAKALDKIVVQKTKRADRSEADLREQEGVTLRSIDYNKQMQVEIEELRADNKSLKANLEETKKKLRSTQLESEKLEKRMHQAETSVQTLRQDLRESKKECIGAQEAARMARGEAETEKQERSLVSGAILKFSEDLKTVEDKWWHSDNDVKKLRSDLEHAKKEWRKHEARADKAEAQLRQKYSECTDTRSNLQMEMRQRSMAEQERTKVEKAYAEESKTASERAEIITRVSKDLREEKRVKDTVTVDLAQTKDRLEKAEEKLKVESASHKEFKGLYELEKEKVWEAREEIRRLNIEIRTLGKDVRQAQNRIDNTAAELKGLGGAYESVAEDLKERQLDWKEEKKKSETFIKQVEDLKKRLQSSEKQLQKVSTDKAEIYSELLDTRRCVREAENEKIKLGSDVNGVQRKILKYEEEIAFLSENHRKVGGEVIDLKLELKDQLAQKQKLMDQIDALKKELRRAEVERDRHEGETLEVRQRERDLRSGIMRNDRRIEKLNGTLRTSQSQLAEVEDERGILKDAALARIQDAKAAERELKVNREEVKRLQTQLADAKAQWKKEVEDLEYNRNLSSRLKPQVDSLQDKVREYEESFKKMAKELRIAKEAAGAAEKSMKEEKENVQKLMQDLKEAEDELDEMYEADSRPTSPGSRRSGPSTPAGARMAATKSLPSLTGARR